MHEFFARDALPSRQSIHGLVLAAGPFHRPSTIPRRSISKQQRRPGPSDGPKEIFIHTFPESSAGDISPEQLSPSVGAGVFFFFLVPLNNH